MNTNQIKLGQTVQLFGSPSEYKVVSINLSKSVCDVISYLGKVVKGNEIQLVNSARTRPSFEAKLQQQYDEYQSHQLVSMQNSVGNEVSVLCRKGRSDSEMIDMQNKIASMMSGEPRCTQCTDIELNFVN